MGATSCHHCGQPGTSRPRRASAASLRLWGARLRRCGVGASGSHSGAAPYSRAQADIGRPVTDKPTGRVVALIVLLILVAAALRGYLPAHDGSTHSALVGNRAALMIIVAALSVTLALVAMAVIARLGDPPAVAPNTRDLSEMLGSGKGRPSWRVLLIGFAVIVAWLLIAILLARLFASDGGGSSVPSAAPTTSPPANGTPPPPRQNPPNDSGDMFGILVAGTPPGAADHHHRSGHHVATAMARSHTGNHRRRLRRVAGPPAAFGIIGAGSRTRAGRDDGPQPRATGGDHRLLCGDGT